MAKLIDCLNCDKTQVRNHGRGMCSACWVRWRRAMPEGESPRTYTVDAGEFERVNTIGANLVADYEELRDWGTRDLKHAAVRLGVRYATLYQALYRRGYRPDRKRGGFYRELPNA